MLSNGSSGRVLPLLLTQIEQHLLLQVVLPVVDGDGIVVALALRA